MRVPTPTGLVRFMPSVTKPPRQNRQSKFFQMMIFPEHKKGSICHSIINALIRNEIADPDYMDTCLSDLQVNPGTKKRLLIIQSSPDGHNNSSSLEQKIIGLFGTLGITLYTFYYPNEYLAVLENSGKAALYQILADFTADCGALLSIAVGKKCQLFQLSLSYQSALTALKYCRSSENGIAFFDDMTLEILLSSISEQEKMLICKKRSLHFLMKKEICFRLTLKQICLFSEPARSCFFTKTQCSTS